MGIRWQRAQILLAFEVQQTRGAFEESKINKTLGLCRRGGIRNSGFQFGTRFETTGIKVKYI